MLNLSNSPVDLWAGVDDSLKAALGRRIDHLTMRAVPLSEALAEWGGRSGVNLSVSWPYLEVAGYSRDTPVTLDLRGVRADQALRVLLDAAQTRTAEGLVGFAEGSVVKVTPAGDLFDREGRRVVMRIYDVRAAFVQLARWDRAFGGSAGESELGDRLVDRLETSVGNNTRADQGGGLGRMHYWGGWLEVEHTPEVQAKVAALLGVIARGGPPVQIGTFDDVPALWHGF